MRTKTGCGLWAVGCSQRRRLVLALRAGRIFNRQSPVSCLGPTAYSPQPKALRAPRASGFSLVAALFLIVVVAALGVFAVRIGVGQQETVNLALLSAKALSAANSGIEYGAYQALVGGTCGNATLNLSEAGLNGFAVNVACIATAHSEAGGAVTVYRIDATSTYGTYGMPDYVSRRVYATFASQP